MARTSGAPGAKLEIDRLCEAVNLAGEPAATAVIASLRETFPEIIWTRDRAGRLAAAVHGGYRPTPY